MIPEFRKKYSFQLNFRENFLVAFLLLGVFFGALFIGCLAALDCMLRPYGGPYLLFSINPRVVTWPFYLWASFWYGRWAVGFLSGFACIIGGDLLYVAYALPLLRNELRMGQRSYRSNAILRTNTDNLVTNWKILDIFVRILNMEVTFVFLYFEVVLVCITLFCTVTLVYQWSSTGVVIRMMMTLLAFAGVFCLGHCFAFRGTGVQMGEEALGTWRKEFWPLCKDWKYMKRVKLSCRPFSFGDGKRYFIEPISVLKFLSSVSRNTFRALITYEDLVDRFTNLKGFRRIY